MEKFYVGAATKTYTCSKLSIDEKVQIVHEAVVKMVPFSDISFKYNVKPSLISYLLYQVKKNPAYLRSKMSKVDSIE